MKGPFHIVIMDDEPRLREHLQRIVKAWAQKAGVTVQTTLLSCGEELIDLYENAPQDALDLILLDIDVPGSEWSGMQTAQRLRQSGFRGLIIFETGYPQFMRKGFEVEAHDFLIKPVEAEDLEESLSRALNKLQQRPSGCLMVHDRSQTTQIPYEDILFLSSRRNYVAIHTQDEVLNFRSSLQTLTDRLPVYFVQIRRTEVVNLQQVRSLYGTKVLMSNGDALEMGPKYAQSVQRAFFDVCSERAFLP